MLITHCFSAQDGFLADLKSTSAINLTIKDYEKLSCQLGKILTIPNKRLLVLDSFRIFMRIKIYV